MPEFFQAGRQAVLETELGADVAVLETLVCREHLNEPFVMQVTAVCTAQPDFAPLLGTPVHVGMLEAPGQSRHFDGILFEVSEAEESESGFHYLLTVRPRMWLMAGNQQSRIFQQKSVPTILTELFRDWGVAYEPKLSGAYEPRDYCVQYRESDFAFVSRLMEEEGLTYYFRHEEGGHTLVVTDGLSGLPEAPDSYGFNSTGVQTGVRRYDALLTSWSTRNRPGPRTVTLWDYHFRTPAPATNIQGQSRSSVPSGPASEAEIYEYPGGYALFGHDKAPGLAAGWSKMRLEAANATREVFSGAGDAFALTVGSRFSLGEAPERAGGEIESYLIISATHTLAAETYRSGGGSSDMRVQIEAIDARIPWRPPLRTPKPIVGGPQPATVVGPAGEVIHVDEHGRVKVHFRWDRASIEPEKRSCWVRVSQAWADGGFGHIVLPRIGQEVLVDFLDGDPDEPIIIGRVYNASRMPPYALPGHKTRSTWRSQTVGQNGSYPNTKEPPASSAVGYNEIRFEDKGGSEEIFIHGQRDRNTWIRFDDTMKIGHNFTTDVGYDSNHTIKRHLNTTLLDGNESRTLKSGSRTSVIEKSDTKTLNKGDDTTKVMMGNYSLKADMGKVTIEAAQEILLKVGNNTIKISPTGIELNGLMVKMKADTTFDLEGLMTTLKASAIMTIQGALVKIN